MNLNDLTKKIAEAVSSRNTTVDPNTIPIQIEGVELETYKVEYLENENLIIMYVD